MENIKELEILHENAVVNVAELPKEHEEEIERCYKVVEDKIHNRLANIDYVITTDKQLNEVKTEFYLDGQIIGFINAHDCGECAIRGVLDWVKNNEIRNHN